MINEINELLKSNDLMPNQNKKGEPVKVTQNEDLVDIRSTIDDLESKSRFDISAYSEKNSPNKIFSPFKKSNTQRKVRPMSA